VERSGCDLICGTVEAHIWRDCGKIRKISVRTVGGPAEIRMGDLSNASRIVRPTALSNMHGVAAFCEDCNEPSVFIKCGKFIGQLSVC
jgi:hypothetical protein